MAKNVEKVGACQEATAVQVQEIRQDMAMLDINAAVTNALSNALPAALGLRCPVSCRLLSPLFPVLCVKRASKGMIRKICCDYMCLWCGLFLGLFPVVLL